MEDGVKTDVSFDMKNNSLNFNLRHVNGFGLGGDD